MRAEFSEVDAAVSRAIDGQRQWAECIERMVDQWLMQNRLSEEPLVYRVIRDSDVVSNSQAVTVEAIRRCWTEREWPLGAMKQSQWNRLYALICGNGPDTITLPGKIDVRRERESVTLHRDA